jgi:hypothetical protein
MDEQAQRCGRCAPGVICPGCPLGADVSSCGLTNKHTLCILWEEEGWMTHLRRIMSDEFVLLHDSAKSGAARDDTITLYDCIDRFTLKETLGKDDAWYATLSNLSNSVLL